MGEWISVADRLPDRFVTIHGNLEHASGDVIVAYMYEGETYVTTGRYHWNEEKWRDLTEEEYPLDVTHWQPFPAPPEITS